MLDIEKSINRFNPFKFELLFDDYLNIIGKGEVKGRKEALTQIRYMNILKLILGFRAADFNSGDCYVLLTQLFTGCRFSEVGSLQWVITGEKLVLTIRCLKGSEFRFIYLPALLPVVLTYIDLLDKHCATPNYKAYCRSLIHSNPNFYAIVKGSHLAVSHLVRHFYIQTLYFVLGHSGECIQERMGWRSSETIENYIDQGIWRKLNLEEKHDRLNNKRTKRRIDTSVDNSSNTNNSTNRNKNKKKKVKKQ